MSAGAVSRPLWPRQHAAHVLAARDPSERAARLAAVPAHLQRWVTHYVIDHEERTRCRSASQRRPMSAPAQESLL